MAGLPPYRAGDSAETLRHRIAAVADPRVSIVTLRKVSDAEIVRVYKLIQRQAAPSGKSNEFVRGWVWGLSAGIAAGTLAYLFGRSK